jgi:hypothetical protein
MVFGLTIHYFESDNSCIIKFDDVDAEWRYDTHHLQMCYILRIICGCVAGIRCYSVDAVS